MEGFEQYADAANKLQLKVQALREGFSKKVADITDDYEDRIADLRVQLTITSEEAETEKAQVEQLQQQLTELNQRLEESSVSQDAEANSSDDPN